MNIRLARAHFANTQNLCILLAAAISYGYEESVIVSTNRIENISLSSSNLRKIVEKCNAAIGEFANKFCISDTLINSIELNERNGQILTELVNYSGASNKAKYQYLRELILYKRLHLNPRAHYYMYIYKCESRYLSENGVNHTYWDPSFFDYDEYEGSNSYSPFYSLSFGHPLFVLDDIYSSQRLSSKKVVSLYEPIAEARAYQNVGSLVDLLSQDYAKNMRVKSLDKEIIIDSNSARDILMGNHFAHVRSLKSLYRKTKEINYTSYTSLKNLNPCFSGTLEYIRAKPIFKELNPCNNIVEKFINGNERIIVVHTRDSKYSYSSTIRDSNFENYIDAIKWLIGQGYKVVRISLESNENSYKHPRFLDLSQLEPKSDLNDQLAILQKAYAFIGTSSGISHWATYFGLPLLFLNASAYPTCTLTSSAIHAGKNIRHLTNNYTKSSLRTLLNALRSTFSDYHQRYYQIFELSPDQILAEVVSFMGSIEEPSANPKTLHILLKKYKIDTSQTPDIYISRLFSERMENILSKFM